MTMLCYCPRTIVTKTANQSLDDGAVVVRMTLSVMRRHCLEARAFSMQMATSRGKPSRFGQHFGVPHLARWRSLICDLAHNDDNSHDGGSSIFTQKALVDGL